MPVNSDTHYKYLTSECRFKIEKVHEAFSLFIKLSTLIVGGVFYIATSPTINAEMKSRFASTVDGLYALIGAGIVMLIQT